MPSPDNPLDAALLRTLLALLDERSVTRAAVKLRQSQPATSHALKRLREILGDPLLVRGQGGLVLTERAGLLRDSAMRALEELDGLLVSSDDFDPSSSRQTFTIALPDHILPTMFSTLMEEFCRRAPLARLTMRALGPSYDFEGALASGTADLVISNWPKPPEYLRRSVLFADRFVCLVDRNHPFTRRKPSAQDYLTASHIAPDDYSIAHRGVVENHLSALRLERNRKMVVGYFLMAPYLIIGTELVFTTTRHFAEHFSTILPLAMIESPIEYPTIEFYQLWHERMHLSPMHRWLRQLVARMRTRRP